MNDSALVFYFERNQKNKKSVSSCVDFESRYGLIEAPAPDGREKFLCGDIELNDGESQSELTGRLGLGGYARRAKRRRRAYFWFFFFFYQKFLGEDTLTASQSKDLVFHEIRSGDGDADRRATRKPRLERLGRASKNLYGTPRKRIMAFCPRAASRLAPIGKRFSLLLLLLRSIKIRQKFLFFFYYARSKVVLLDNAIPCTANIPAMSPRCRLLKTFNKQGGLGHETEPFSSRSPGLVTQHGQGFKKQKL